jgi:NAD(P)H-nitrite reductase large subunit
MSADDQPLHPAIRALKAVCRCNSIKYKTIERAILAGACTVREVAIRTRATTGYCGGSCTPEIQQMIDQIHGGAITAPAPPPQEDEDAWWIRPAVKK